MQNPLPDVKEEVPYKLNGKPHDLINEHKVGVAMNNLAAKGQLEGIREIQRWNKPMGDGTNFTPEYKIIYEDGTEGFADYYEPESGLAWNIVTGKLADKGPQTGKGTVIMRL